MLTTKEKKEWKAFDVDQQTSIGYICEKEKESLKFKVHRSLYYSKR